MPRRHDCRLAPQGLAQLALKTPRLVSSFTEGQFALVQEMASKFKAFLDHPAGPKTVFFWAPTMKWGLVIAGLADINRPVEKISTGQQCALAATGFIWARCEALCSLAPRAHCVTVVFQMQHKSSPRT